MRYLADAHAVEQQAIFALGRSPGMAGDERLAGALRRHAAETREHRSLIVERLAAHRTRPAPVKDLALTLARAGFLAYVRSQPDTPGKLVADSYAYEHLEIAGYELLRRAADAAGDGATSAAAERILADERRMTGDLAAAFDAVAEASLRRGGGGVRTYLADAHALETESLGLLHAAVRMAGHPVLAAVYRTHRAETLEHRRAVSARLHDLGGRPSPMKDAALGASAAFWGLFYRAHADAPGKIAAFAFAAEHLEIAGYELLRRVADRRSDGETADLARRLTASERSAAARLEGAFDEAAAAALSAGPR